jgi:hypothetical protein
MIANVRFRTWKHPMFPHLGILQFKIFILTRLPGSRDRRVGSNKILDLSRNCPSQPTQFLLSLPRGRNPTSWNALPENAAIVVPCVWEEIADTFSKLCLPKRDTFVAPNVFEPQTSCAARSKGKKDLDHSPSQVSCSFVYFWCHIQFFELVHIWCLVLFWSF